jgi:pyridoxine kinase
MICEVMLGIEERGVLHACDGVLSGYIGTAEIGAAILQAVAKIKRANPKARYCCDPVIGDVGRGVYVQPGVREFMRELALPAADLITPNAFELEALSGCGTATLADALAAADVLRAAGPRAILVTSLHTAETPVDAIDLLACDDRGRYRLRTPKLPTSVNGAGDVIAALFFFHYLRTSSAAEALAHATSSTFGLLRATTKVGAPELLLVEAQEEIVNPSRMFRAEQV